MLLLTRREGDEIYIGEDVVIRLEWIQGNRAQIRVIAKRSLPVSRGELLTWEKREQIQDDIRNKLEITEDNKADLKFH